MNKLVLYTDGSFKSNIEDEPTLGCYGSGAHGYIFNLTDGLKSTTDAPSNYTLTTTGYVINSEFDKEFHKAVSPHIYIDAAYSFLNKGTVSRAELLAIRCSLDSLLERNKELEVSEIDIWADSTYAIGVVNKILQDPDSVNNLSKDTPNLDIILELKETISKVIIDIKLKVDKIQAHSIYIGNNIADNLAYYAREQSGEYHIEKSFNIFKVAKGSRYWDFSIPQNELISFKQLFFTNSLRAQHTEILYSVMNYKTDVEPGTRTHDALMGIVSVANPPQIVEEAIQAYHKAIKTTSILSTVNLKNLYSRNVAYMYQLFGSKCFRYFFKKREVVVNKEKVVQQVESPGLSNRLLMDMQFMYGFISLYRKIKSDMKDKDKFGPTSNLLYLNITKLIYKVNDKKKNVCILENGSTYLPIKEKVFGKELKFPISLGKDTLERNQFKRLESKDPKVYLVIEKASDKSFRYYMLIEAEDDIGVYSNLYSNRIITD